MDRAKLASVLAIVMTWMTTVGGDAADEEDEELLLLFNGSQIAMLMEETQPRSYTLRSGYWMKPRLQSFFHTTVDTFYDPSDWLTHYRMTKSTFHEIANAIAPLIQRQHTNYRAAITVCQRLSVTLLYLATGITQQQVASMEGISNQWSSAACMRYARQ